MDTPDELKMADHADMQRRLARNRGEPLVAPAPPEPVTADDVMQAVEAYAAAYSVSLKQPRGSTYWQRAERLRKTLAETLDAFGRECAFNGSVL